MKKELLYSFALCAGLFLSSCSNDDDQAKPKKASETLRSEFYTVNEGSFGAGNGSIGYYNGKDTSAIIQERNIFEKANNRGLGDVVQSLAFYNGKGYIAVNNSQKVEVVNASDFKSVATINIGSPRYFQGISSSKGYITDWTTNSVQVIDLNSNTVLKTIKTGTGPEKMVRSGNYVYVANLGGFGNDSTISVIDVSTDAVVKTIHVGYRPNSLQLDNSGNLWVLCEGLYNDYNTPDDDVAGALVQVSLAQQEVVKTLTMLKNSDHPSALAVNPAGTELYYLNGPVYRHNTTAASLSATPFINNGGTYTYGLSVNPSNGDILLCNASFTSSSTVVIYNQSGSKTGQISSGIGTSNVVFK